jgi:hypothetical protein
VRLGKFNVAMIGVLTILEVEIRKGPSQRGNVDEDSLLVVALKMSKD